MRQDWQDEALEAEDFGQQARDNALSFEATKVNMIQDKAGVLLKLRIHPNDVPQSLHRHWVGTRFAVVLVAIDEDEKPKIDEDKLHTNRLVQSAGMLCRNDEFQEFLGANDEEECIELLRDLLGIKSRSEMHTNSDACAIFENIRNQFAAMKEGKS